MTGMILLRTRGFALLWCGQSLSGLADSSLRPLVLIWVYTLTRSAITVSLVGLAEALPLLALAPFAGVFVDRWSRADHGWRRICARRGHPPPPAGHDRRGRAPDCRRRAWRERCLPIFPARRERRPAGDCRAGARRSRQQPIHARHGRQRGDRAGWGRSAVRGHRSPRDRCRPLPHLRARRATPPRRPGPTPDNKGRAAHVRPARTARWARLCPPFATPPGPHSGRFRGAPRRRRFERDRCRVRDARPTPPRRERGRPVTGERHGTDPRRLACRPDQCLGHPSLPPAAGWRAATGEKIRLVGETPYQAESWSRERRVVYKAEALDQGPHTRFVVTTRTDPPAALYDWYVDRGEAERWIKDFKRACIADRLSDHRFWANQFRLVLHAAA